MILDFNARGACMGESPKGKSEATDWYSFSAL